MADDIVQLFSKAGGLRTAVFLICDIIISKITKMNISFFHFLILRHSCEVVNCIFYIAS